MKNVKDLTLRIAGEITLSSDPGSSLRKWREIFGISQSDLAKHLGITSSTISDYESNRRKSPGVGLVKKIVEALIDIDLQRGGWVTKRLAGEKLLEDVFEVIELPKGIKAMEFVENIEGKVHVHEELLKERVVYGYTIIDSLRAILELPGNEFIKIYGSTTDRALIFANVSMGRSPLVAIKVTPLRPAIVVLHNISQVDEIGLKIAEKENIPVVTTVLPLDEIKNRIDKLL